MGLILTDNRVRIHTSARVNERIKKATDASIEYYGWHPALIPERLDELNHEWDIERTLEANAASISLIGLLLGLLVNRKFILLPVVVAGFLLQHSFQRWCPPVPVFRRMGIRTTDEILREKMALEFLSGKFHNILRDHDKPKNEKIDNVIRAL